MISLARDILELKFEQPDASQPPSKRQRVDKTAGHLECVQADALDWMKRVPEQQARHSNTGTTTQAQQHRHSSTGTATQAQQHRHSNTGTATQPQQHIHINTATTATQAQRHSHSSIEIYKLSCVSLQEGCLLLDAYGGDGRVPAALQQPDFLRDCRAAVAEGGLVSAHTPTVIV